MSSRAFVSSCSQGRTKYRQGGDARSGLEHQAPGPAHLWRKGRPPEKQLQGSWSLPSLRLKEKNPEEVEN